MVSVAFDVGPLHGHRTGIGGAVSSLLRRLEHRDDVDLLPYVTSARAAVRPPERRLPLPAAAAHRLWARSSGPALDRWLGNPDLVHGTNYVVPPARCPRLVSVYDCWFLDHPEDAVDDVARAGRVLRRSVADGAHVLTSSDATAGRVRDLLGTDRVTSVHLGPPEPPSTNGDGGVAPVVDSLADAPFVVAIGTTERRKNLPTLVAAFGRLAQEHELARLVIAGARGDAASDVIAARARLDEATDARIVQLDRIDDPTKRALLTGAAALAYPSLDEGFGFPILEAHQAGVPVVASTAGSIPEVAGSAALLSPPDDVDALAANLHWVLTSENIRTTLVERGRANLARFDWTTTASAYAELYRALVEAGP